MKRNTYIILGASLFVFVVFFALMMVTPYHGDDYLYHYKFSQASHFNGEPILNEQVQNVGDAIVSAYNHYFVYNGRVIFHGLEKMLLLLPKWVFNLLNAIMFALLVFLGFNHVEWKKRHWLITFTAFILFGSMLWFYLPQPFITITWFTGSMVYLWSMVATLAFMVLLRRAQQQNLRYVWLWAILSIFLAWGHECIAVGIAGACVIYAILCWIRHKKISKEAYILGCAYCIGAIMLVLSPGLRGRAEGIESDSYTLSNILSILLSTINTKPLNFLLLLEIILLIFRRKETLQFIKNNLFYHIAIMVYIGFALISANAGGGRAKFGLVVITSILLFKLILPFIERTPKVIMSIIACILLSYGGYDYATAWQSNKTRFEDDKHYIAMYQEHLGEYVVPHICHPLKNSRLLYYNFTDHKFFMYHDTLSCKENYHHIASIPLELYDYLYNNQQLNNLDTMTHLYMPSDKVEWCYFPTDEELQGIDTTVSTQKVTLTLSVLKHRTGLPLYIANLRHKSNQTTVTIEDANLYIFDSTKAFIVFPNIEGSYRYPIEITSVTFQ